MLHLGIDLGGTKIEGAVLDETGQILFRKRIDTEQDQGYEHILSQIKKLYGILEKESGGGRHTLGVGTPGTVSRVTGKLKNSNTLCLNNRLGVNDLEILLEIPVLLENDANCFALAEAMNGAGAGKKVVFGVIMGTGCGGGLIVNGQIHRGLQGLGGEWGHMSIDPSGPQCYCGSRGCVETYISGGGLERAFFESFSERVTVKVLMERYREAYEPARTFMAKFFSLFGRSLANLINILDPDVVVMGGGLSNIDEIYSTGVSEVRRNIFSDELITPIVKNKLGDSAGVIGAALLGKKTNNRSDHGTQIL